MHAIDPNTAPTQTFEWGAIKWLVSRGRTPGAAMTFGEVLLLPGQGHARHPHPVSEEILYVLSREGEQMLEADDKETWFPVKAGDCIYVETAQFHSTVDRGWPPMRLLAIYNPGGPERDLEGLPDFHELAAGRAPTWTRS